MASFVLIHGSWHGGWCFDEVKALLEGEGHHVIAPDLPGMGGTEEELAAVTLDGWGRFAVELCRTAPQRPVVLVGHSRGGLVISTAAEKDPGVIDALVYICAMMLPDGMSRADLKALEEPNPAFDGLIRLTPGGHGSTVSVPVAGEVFAQLSPPDKVARGLARLVAEPHGPRSEPVRVTAVRWGSLPRTYIECLADRTIPLASQRLMQELSPGAAVVTLDADHSPFLSRPRELVDALLQAVPIS